MTQLPAIFTENTRQLLGEERFERYLKSFEEDVPVSIRLNPLKMADGRWQIADSEPVPWCRDGYYLEQRPNFTMDPLFHAGCYYVQEAASMFLDEVLKQFKVQSSKFKVALTPSTPGTITTAVRNFRVTMRIPVKYCATSACTPMPVPYWCWVWDVRTTSPTTSCSCWVTTTATASACW